MHNNRNTKFQHVVVIEPDATDDLGHFGAYAHNLDHELRQYCPVHFLLYRESTFEPAGAASAQRCLSHHSWQIGPERKSTENSIQQFSREVMTALDQLANHRDPIAVYMYCASLPHAKALVDLAIARPQYSFCLNLFYMSFDSFLTPRYRAKWQPVISLAEGSDQVLLTSPTAEASDAVRVLHKWYIAPTPHPCPSLSDASALRAIQKATAQIQRTPHKPLRVLFPASSRNQKGIDLALRAAAALSQAKRGKYQITIRATHFQRRHWTAVEAIQNDIEILHGTLSDAEFDKMMTDANIVVLPYQPRDFEYRTSGLVLEAIYRGKPCVVMANTWLGNFVTRNACGVAIQSEDEQNLISAIVDTTKQMTRMRKNAIVAAERHYTFNRWQTLAEVVMRMDRARTGSARRIGQFVAGHRLPQELVVMGNGPSLKGFDFRLLKPFDVIGMNAAYRFWDRINWYPRYYACLDTVVGLSHQNEIERLVAQSEDNGIELFLLRDNLIRNSSMLAEHHKAINFDELRECTALLSDESVTTGSHAALFGVYLGYRRLYLLGIDCNYVEKIEGAERVEGRLLEKSSHTLEIREIPAENPNYFFDDYQRMGDRFNIPNPGRALHTDAWRGASVLMRAEGAKVLNANLKSKVDAFDFCEFEAASPCRTPTIIARETVLGQIEEWPAPVLTGIHLGGMLRAPHEPGARAQFDETGFVARLALKPGRQGVMVDVGAHRGGAARRFADAGWQVICHEPDPDNRAALEAWARGHANVVTDARAVADVSDRQLTLYASPESTGISSLLSFHDSHAPRCAVRTCTVADIVRERRLEGIDVLKIDAEGYDLPILRGISWEQLQPEIIICEYEDRKTRALGYGVEDMARFLELKGYWVLVSEWHPIQRYGGPHSWKGLRWYVPGECDAEGWGNLMAFRSPPSTPELLAAADEEIRVSVQPPAGHAASSDLSRVLANSSQHQRMQSGLLRRVQRLFDGKKQTVRRGGLAAVCAIAVSAPVAAVLLLPAAGAALAISVTALITAVAGLSAIFGLVRREAGRRKWQDEKLRDALEAAQKRVGRLERMLREARDALGRADQEVAGRQDELERTAVETRDVLERADQEVAGRQDELERTLVETRDVLERADQEVAGRQDELERTLKDARDMLGQANERIAARQDALERASTEQRQELQRLRRGSAPHLATFTRYPEPEVIERLTRIWAPKLGLQFDESELCYLAHRLRTMEANGIGRMATSMEAALLRILAARAVPRDRLDVLEIGTLFGLGAAAVYEGARGRFDEVHLTLIDPLRGYYGDHRPDPLTGAIADREVLLYNLRQAGAQIEDVTIVQGRSEEQAVRTQAAGRRYDLLIVDGDHSAKGVARDFERYAPLVRKGGFILFDDYDVPEWPAIKTFVDEEVAGRSELGFLGGEFRTAVFKVRSAIGGSEGSSEPHVFHRLDNRGEVAIADARARRSEG
jgi:FkbM family methyltransferase